MDRRRFIQAVSATGIAATAGCIGEGNFFEVQYGPTQVPPVPENRPNAVYYPSHIEGMSMLGTSNTAAMNGSGDDGGMNDSANVSQGTDSNGSAGKATSDVGEMPVAGDYQFGLMYSYPHRFWNVNGTTVTKTPLEDSDSLHLMASVWEPTTGVVIPDTGLSVELSQNGNLVSEEAIYPMLSERMGFHYGSNFELPGDGTYTATLSVGALNTRHTGRFHGLFEQPRAIDIEFEYSERAKNDISFRLLDRAGQQGAVEPMDMPMMPQAYAPDRSELPGRVLGEATSGDAIFVPTVLNTPPEGVDGTGQYLAVSARIPYYPLVLPAMGLSGTVTRGTETVFDGELVRTIDPELNYHYGAAVDSVQSGDELTITVDIPPQTARHEGYETAFVQTSEMTVAVP